MFSVCGSRGGSLSLSGLCAALRLLECTLTNAPPSPHPHPHITIIIISTRLIRRRTAKRASCPCQNLVPSLSSRSLLSPRGQLRTYEFPPLPFPLFFSLPPLPILTTPMKPCSASLPPALPPHSNSSPWQHRALDGVEWEDTEQGARVGWP